MTRPSNAAIIERALSLCNIECFAVALQCRRLRSSEPEDRIFVLRWWADLQFLIVSLRRLRCSASIASGVASVKAAIDEFDQALPSLKTMRDVAEHINEYALDNKKRHLEKIDRKQIQVSFWDGTEFAWLDGALNIDHALAAAEKLFASIQLAARNYRSKQ